VGTIVDAVVAKGGVVCITADHGNAEEVRNIQTSEIDKEHATNPVPFVVCGTAFAGKPNEALEAVGWDLGLLTPVGMLADVAPTVLEVMSIRVPKGMTGKSLL
jgi:2,3-bisphosphoglycerate-independent phosphoglycerate mutase